MTTLLAKVSADDVESAIRSQLRRVSVNAALESDEGFIAYCKRQSGMEHGPFVRAKIYPYVPMNQDIWCRDFGGDPRRPVVMRGAVEVLRVKYEGKSTWAYVIADRYLKKKRFTAFYENETDAMREKVLAHMHRRGHYVHDMDKLVGFSGCGPFGGSYYLNGKHFAHVTIEEWKRAKRTRNHPDEVKDVIVPQSLAQRPQIYIPKNLNLTIHQKKIAAYRALVTLGIKI